MIAARLVYGSISGSGQDGPHSQRGAVDQIAQGLGLAPSDIDELRDAGVLAAR